MHSTDGGGQLHAKLPSVSGCSAVLKPEKISAHVPLPPALRTGLQYLAALHSKPSTCDCANWVPSYVLSISAGLTVSGPQWLALGNSRRGCPCGACSNGAPGQPEEGWSGGQGRMGHVSDFLCVCFVAPACRARDIFPMAPAPVRRHLGSDVRLVAACIFVSGDDLRQVQLKTAESRGASVAVDWLLQIGRHGTLTHLVVASRFPSGFGLSVPE